jgi:hypothetical protein
METQLENIINREARIDWRAAALAGLVTGAVFWLFSHGTPWFTSGMVSPTLMGRDLEPSNLIPTSQSIVVTLIQFGMAVVYTMVVALFVTPLRGMWAIGAGGVVGMALYALNFVIFRQVIDGDLTGSELQVLVTHIIFSMVAAGIYKGLAARRFTRAPSA